MEVNGREIREWADIFCCSCWEISETSVVVVIPRMQLSLKIPYWECGTFVLPSLFLIAQILPFSHATVIVKSRLTGKIICKLFRQQQLLALYL